MEPGSRMLINFLPWREQWYRQRMISLLMVNALMCFFVAALLAVVVMAGRPAAQKSTADLQNLQDDHERLDTLMDEVPAAQVLWRGRRERLEHLINGQLLLGILTGVLAALDERARQAGRELFLDTLDFSESGLMMEGTAVMAGDIDTFVQHLTSALAHRNWRLDSLQQHYQAGQGFKFELRVGPVPDDA